jgi:hypothetical protein
MTPKSIHARSRESPPACDIHMNLMLNWKTCSEIGADVVLFQYIL